MVNRSNIPQWNCSKHRIVIQISLAQSYLIAAVQCVNDNTACNNFTVLVFNKLMLTQKNAHVVCLLHFKAVYNMTADSDFLFIFADKKMYNFCSRTLEFTWIQIEPIANCYFCFIHYIWEQLCQFGAFCFTLFLEIENYEIYCYVFWLYTLKSHPQTTTDWFVLNV